MNRKWFGIGLIVLGIILIVFFIFLFFVQPIRNEKGLGGLLPELPFGKGKVDTVDENPIGAGDGVAINPDGVVTGSDTERPVLFQITDFPVTGYRPDVYQKEILDTVVRLVDIENPDGSVTTEEYQEEIVTIVDLPNVRYHDKDGGLIYETMIDDGLIERVLIDNPINGMYESFFTPDNRVFMRYVDTDSGIIKTYRGTLASSAARVTCPYDFNTPHQVGDSGRDIELIQSYIRQIINPPQALNPGVFDEVMKEAVRAFQSVRGIQVDGIIKTQTNKELQAVCLESEQRKIQQQVSQNDTAPFSFSGIFIDDQIVQFALHPFENEMFRLIHRPDTAWGVISNTTGESLERIYDFNFRDWIVEWVGDTTLSFTTKASGLVKGNAYLYNLEEKNFFNVLKGYEGLTTRVNADGSSLLYAYAVGGRGNQFGVLSLDDRTLRPLPLNTLPEKCVWSQDGTTIYCMVPEQMVSALYPDRWYQGEVVFDDALWRIDTTTGATALIETFANVAFDIDGVRLQLSEDESFIFFIDQRTGYLWARDLEN